MIQDVVAALEKHNFEAVMAGCAVLCGSADSADDLKKIRAELTQHFQKAEAEQALLNAKNRYYDCVLSCVSPEYQTHLRLLLKEGTYLDVVRKTLCLSESRIMMGGSFYDRIQEWKILCQTKEVPFLTKEILLNEFDKKGVQNDQILFQTIAETAPLYFLRRLQVLDRDIFRRIHLMQLLLSPQKNLRIYEYGCGAADVGLFFALNGHRVAVSEAEAGMLPLVKKRFELRNLQAEYFGASAEIPIPSPSGRFDLIVAVEVLEHIRNPMALLENLDSLMDSETLVFLGSFPFNDTNAVGDHLQEALSLQAGLLKWIKGHWVPV